jgi:hypothetical protein
MRKRLTTAEKARQAALDGRARELALCRHSLRYFCYTHCQILAATGKPDRGGAWIPFRLWPAQVEVADELQHYREVVLLKARQLGFTWLVIAHALRKLLCFPVATVLFFSQRDDEAEELVDFRLREMYNRLPEYMRESPLQTDTSHELTFPGGSRAMAFSTKGGRSYAATLAIIDEADHVEDLGRMLSAIAPTVDAGGQIILLSTADKSRPESAFKRVYRAAKNKENSFHPIFHGWEAAPWRDRCWYDERRRSILAQTGALDDLHQEFAATDAEALSARSLDKRIPAAWLEQCFAELRALPLASQPGAPAVPGLAVFAPPHDGKSYVVGADPAEGNPTSDDSAAVVLDGKTGEEVANLVGRFEPEVFATYIYSLANWYKTAAILCERNNHGHAVLLWLRNFGHGVRRLEGLDGKPGWQTTTLSKTHAYDRAAECLKNQEVMLHSFETFAQLSSIDGLTLRAPEGQKDDRAMAWVLGVLAFIAQFGKAKEVFYAAPARPEDTPMGFLPEGLSPFDKVDDGRPPMYER